MLLYVFIVFHCCVTLTMTVLDHLLSKHLLYATTDHTEAKVYPPNSDEDGGTTLGCRCCCARSGDGLYSRWRGPGSPDLRWGVSISISSSSSRSSPSPSPSPSSSSSSSSSSSPSPSSSSSAHATTPVPSPAQAEDRARVAVAGAVAVTATCTVASTTTTPHTVACTMPCPNGSSSCSQS